MAHTDRESYLLCLTFIGAGDYILALPSIRLLRRARPNAHITALVRADGRFKGLLKTTRDIDEILIIDHKNDPIGSQVKTCMGLRKYHYTASLHYTPAPRFALYALLAGAKQRIGYETKNGLTHCMPLPSDMHRIDQFNGLLASIDIEIPSREKAFELTRPDIPEADYAAARDVFEKDIAPHAKPYIGVCAGGSEENRRWPVENFGACIAALQKQFGGTTVMFGGPREEPVTEQALDSAARHGADASRCVIADFNISLMAMTALLENMDVFITNDTAPMHLAASVGCPLVNITKLWETDVYRPYTPGSISVINDAAADNAEHANDLLRRIPVEPVVEAAEKLLNGERPRGEVVRVVCS